MDTTANKDAFITLKDLKPNFAKKPTCRLIDPTKSEAESFREKIHDWNDNKITRASTFNQWKNTASVIESFKAIKNKQHHSFTCKTFYPYAQKATLAKEGRYNIWRLNGQLRRCWNMRTTRKFPPFPTAELDYTETTDWSFQTPHQDIQKASKRKYAASSITMGYGSPS